VFAMLKVEVSPAGFKEAEKALAGIKDGYKKAASEAINRGLLAGRTAAAKNIAARYNITSSEVKDHIVTKNASWSRIEGSLNVSGKMLNVSKFKLSIGSVVTPVGKRQVVSATIIKGNKVVLPGAFVTPKGSVMSRRQDSRFPIFPMSTISVAHMSGEKEISKAIQDALNQSTQDRLKHNIEYALQKGAEATSEAAEKGLKSK
jgi:minor tail protein Z (GPZ)